MWFPTGQNYYNYYVKPKCRALRIHAPPPPPPPPYEVRGSLKKCVCVCVCVSNDDTCMCTARVAYQQQADAPPVREVLATEYILKQEKMQKRKSQPLSGSELVKFGKRTRWFRRWVSRRGPDLVNASLTGS